MKGRTQIEGVSEQTADKNIWTNKNEAGEIVK
jgi:hypothetical protein